MNKKGMETSSFMVSVVLSVVVLLVATSLLFTQRSNAQDTIDPVSRFDDFDNDGVTDGLDRCSCDVNNVQVSIDGRGWCVAQGVSEEEQEELVETLNSEAPGDWSGDIQYEEDRNRVLYENRACLEALVRGIWPTQEE